MSLKSDLDELIFDNIKFDTDMNKYILNKSELTFLTRQHFDFCLSNFREQIDLVVKKHGTILINHLDLKVADFKLKETKKINDIPVTKVKQYIPEYTKSDDETLSNIVDLIETELSKIDLIKQEGDTVHYNAGIMNMGLKVLSLIKKNRKLF